MKKINFYIFILSCKYILINLFFLTLIVLFLNLIEITRLLDASNSNIISFFKLSFLKIPSVISETIPFVIVISVAFLFKNLISNNELISIRNMGYSIIDIYKPIALSIFIFGLFILMIINPMSAKFEREFDNLTSKDFSNMYSIKFINNGMWIKNITENKDKNYINIQEINLETMEAKTIKILNINPKNNRIIIAKQGKIMDRLFNLEDVTILNINKNIFQETKIYNLNLNFDKINIIDSMSDFKFIPFYKYREHIKNLKKFNLHSSEVSLYYLSEILKPFFLIIIGFAVMGFSGKFKRNENFFKVLFIAILIGFLVYLFKEFIIKISNEMNLSYIFSYFIIFSFPLFIGLYQTIKIETD